MPTSGRVKSKKKCCKSGPRCKRCPVVLRRLDKAGYARRTTKGNYKVVEVVPRSVLKSARAR